MQMNRAAGQIAQGGLNENYAREIMELHTLGVDGGYTQKDVTELARVLTGWTITAARRRPGRRLHLPPACFTTPAPRPSSASAFRPAAASRKARR